MDLYKRIIWILWICGYIWEMKDFTTIRSKIKLVAMKCWTVLICLVVIAIFILIFIYLVLLRNTPLFLGYVIALMSMTFCLILLVWIHDNRKLFQNLILLFEEEYSTRRIDYQPVKTFAIELSVLLMISPPILMTSITCIQFFFDGYLQVFYNILFDVEVSDNFWALMIFATVFVIVTIFILPMGVLSYFVTAFSMFVFNKRHLDLLLSSAKYDSAEDLKKTRKVLCQIEVSLSKTDEFTSVLMLVTVPACTFFFCISVVYFFTSEIVLNSVKLNMAVNIIFLMLFGSLIVACTVLYTDQKTDKYVRRVYAISATKDPNDVDYAIQAEMLAKQIHTTKILIKFWKFYAYNRFAMLELLCSMLSYIILAAKLIPGAQDYFVKMGD